MAKMKVDTSRLEYFADRLDTVNRRLNSLDGRIDRLYYRCGLLELFKLMSADAGISYSNRLKKCADYLRNTQKDLENTETRIQNQDPLNFSPIQAILTNFRPIIVRPGGILRPIPIPIGPFVPVPHIIPGIIPPFYYPPRPKPWLRPPIFIGTGPILGGILGAIWEDVVTSNWDITFGDGALLNFTKTGEDESAYVKLFAGEAGTSDKLTYGKYKNKGILGDKDHLNVNVKQDKKDYYQYNKDEKWYKGNTTLLEKKAEAKIEGSVIDIGTEGDAGWGKGSAGVKVLTGEAHASASAGLYVYTKDKDGNVVKMFSPGVSAEVGASVAVVEASAEGRIGLGEDNNMLGVYGNAEVEALSAEAKAKIALNAKEIYAGASAEANLAKVSGTAGVSVLGTDVGVSGSLKIGAGAHAEIGFTDGKLKIDVGAAVGIGFDLGLEVDVSGTVDAVTDFAESAWEGVTDFTDKLGDGISDMGKNISKGLSDAGKSIEKGLNDMGKNIQKGAENVGKFFKNLF